MQCQVGFELLQRPRVRHRVLRSRGSLHTQSSLPFSRVGDTSTSAGNHDTLQSSAFPGRTLTALPSWHKRQQSARRLPVVEVHRAHCGYSPATTRSSMSDSRKSARLTKTFHENPERLQSSLTLAKNSILGLDARAALGGGGVPVRPALRGGFRGLPCWTVCGGASKYK